jgi:20S proteasome subunit alpha 7
MQYDLSSTSYSPDGKIFQVEYATKAVENSGTAVGIKCKDGILLAVEKLLMSKLLVPGTQRRLHTVAANSGMAIAGLSADARQIVNRAREEAQQYK